MGSPLVRTKKYWNSNQSVRLYDYSNLSNFLFWLTWLNFFTCLSSFVLSTWPNHFNLACLSFRETDGCHRLSLITTFLTKSSHLTPTIFLNMPISNAPSLLSYVCVKAQDIAPYLSTINIIAFKVFIFTLRLISLLPHSLPRSIPKVLVAPALLLSIPCTNFPSLLITLPRHVNISTCFIALPPKLISCIFLLPSSLPIYRT